MNNFEAYIFDLDGTILDSNPLNLECFLYALEKHLKKDVTPEEVKSLFGRPLLEQMQYFSKEKAEDLIYTYRTYMSEIHDERVRLFPESLEVLQELSKKEVKCALVTSKTREYAVRALKLFEIEKYFDVKVFYEDTTKHKPHPEPYLKAINELNINPQKILSIGDSPFDIKGSQAAGLKTAIVSWTDFPKEEIEKAAPDYVIDSLKVIL